MNNKIYGSLSIFPTWKCNIACKHCANNCSMSRTESVNLNRLSRWLDDAFDIGFSPACISGGEPFLHPNAIQQISSMASKRKIPLLLQTNGYWAKSIHDAKEILEPLLPIKQLGFSYDNFHKEYINREFIFNGIQAANDLGIENTCVSVSYVDKTEDQAIRKEFSSFPRTNIISWPFVPIGRGARIQNHSFAGKSWKDLPERCTAGIPLEPIIHPNGDVHICYHLIMCLEKNNPLLLGNLQKSKLSDLLALEKYPLYCFIKRHGIKKLGFIVQRSKHEIILHQKFQDLCHFCYEIFKQKSRRNFILKMLHSPYLRKKLDF